MRVGSGSARRGHGRPQSAGTGNRRLESNPWTSCAPGPQVVHEICEPRVGGMSCTITRGGIEQPASTQTTIGSMSSFEPRHERRSGHSSSSRSSGWPVSSAIRSKSLSSMQHGECGELRRCCDQQIGNRRCSVLPAQRVPLDCIDRSRPRLATADQSMALGGYDRQHRVLLRQTIGAAEDACGFDALGDRIHSRDRMLRRRRSNERQHRLGGSANTIASGRFHGRCARQLSPLGREHLR